MNRVVFYITIHSFVDIITNSSSELFVGRGNSKKLVEELVMQVYPDYTKEYSEIKSIEDLTDSELDTFICYHCEPWGKKDTINGFTSEEMYKEEKRFPGFWDLKPGFVKKYRKRILDGIDPERRMYFMFSKQQNPNWDYQEKLMDIMDRYHLG